MYPLYLRQAVRTPALQRRIFVAMSFAQRFLARFERVIAPSIGSLSFRDTPLEPHRVDSSIVGDSIMAEIVEGISNDVLVFADVSSIGAIEGRAVRNGNVLYELGLAHAMREPEQVVVFRSDTDALEFDVAGIRIRSYDPDAAPDDAQRIVTEALSDAITATRFSDRLRIRETAGLLDAGLLGLLFSIRGLPGDEQGVDYRTDVRVQPALWRLLDLGLIECCVERFWSPERPQATTARTHELLRYKTTDLGNDVFLWVGHQTGFVDAMARSNPEMEKAARDLAEWMGSA
jgi:hypothetical protein